jgi:hypothetical protein
VKRPIGVTIIAVLTFFGAVGLALGSAAFFIVAVMGMTGGDEAEPVSVAIAGMGVAGGLSLLVLAGVGVFLTIGVLKLREWAWFASLASVVAGIGCTILSLFAFRGYLMLPDVPSIICHLLVMVMAVWMIAYLQHPRVRQAFGELTASPAR